MSGARYTQQIAVEGFGEEAQAKLLDGRVLIIGAGGLGTSVATLLAAAGVGSITIMDPDRVDVTNLHRQFQFAHEDVGAFKAAVLAERLKIQNPDVRIQAITEPFTEVLAHMVADRNVVCDCTDNLEARFAIDAACGGHRIPLAFATAQGWEGYVTVLHHLRGFHLREAFDLSAFYADALLNCANTGIMPTTCAVIGSLQANEVLKLLSKTGPVLDGVLLCMDVRQNVQRKFILRRPGA
ncbi:MAG: HesA/MoeB/ThiF family protein [Flavobacteriales bacterium]|nr:HesA/MoeB/ThiF family protein [Flavobacteriales bacterium]